MRAPIRTCHGLRRRVTAAMGSGSSSRASGVGQPLRLPSFGALVDGPGRIPTCRYRRSILRAFRAAIRSGSSCKEGPSQRCGDPAAGVAGSDQAAEI